MDLTIDEMQSQVEVTSARGGDAGGGPGSSAPARGTAELLAALRPIVLQIVREELEEFMRIHG